MVHSRYLFYFLGRWNVRVAEALHVVHSRYLFYFLGRWNVRAAEALHVVHSRYIVDSLHLSECFVLFKKGVV